jgi:hypothetical protein
LDNERKFDPEMLTEWKKALAVKFFYLEKIMSLFKMELVLVNTCASSCGDTGEADVIRNYWV